MRLSNPKPEEIWASALELRPKIHERFPFVITVGCYYPDMDKVVHWCWITFGPKDGRCDEEHTTFPSCPNVLANSSLKFPEDLDDPPEWSKTGPVIVHHHHGTWTTHWLGKTDYDFGNLDFCFSTEQQKDLFLRFLQYYGEGLGDPAHQ